MNELLEGHVTQLCRTGLLKRLSTDSVLLASRTPGLPSQGFLLLHGVECRIGLAQELFNCIPVLRIDGNSHADRELWSVTVFGNAFADALGYLVGLLRVGFR